MDLFNKKLIQFVDHVESWQAALILASQPLVENDYVIEEFSQRLIDETNRLGPYYILAKDLAMAHISPEPSIKKNGMSLLYLNEPIAFKADGSHQVKFLFVLATTDQDSHLNLLREMATLFGNQKFYQAFYNLKDLNDLEKLLEQFSSSIK